MSEAEDAARWCADVAAVLLAASDRTVRLAAQIAEDWLDDRGHEWAGRAALLHRELERSAAEAAELSTRLDDPAQAPPIPPPGPGSGRHGLRPGGTRLGGTILGGTNGARADDEIGMQMAQLPPA